MGSQSHVPGWIVHNNVNVGQNFAPGAGLQKCADGVRTAMDHPSPVVYTS